MANTIQIKRGSGTPTTSNTSAYELAYDYTANKLYIHDANGTASMQEITGTDTNTTYIGGTNLTLSGTTFNVDDKFLKNDASDTTSGTITAAGFTTAGTLAASTSLTIGSNSNFLTTQLKVGDGTRDIRLNANHGSKAAVGTVGSHDFNFFTANTIRATVDSGGNFGIGTESPAGKLHIDQSLDNTLIVSDNPHTTTNATSGISFGGHSNGNTYIDTKTHTGGLLVGRIGEGTETGYTRTWLQVDATNSNVTFGGQLTIGGALTGVTGLYGASSTLTLYNNTYNFKNASSGDMMSLTSTGLGIGTTSPDERLSVVSGSTSRTAHFGRYEDNGLFLHSEAAADDTHYNWMIQTQENIDGGLEIHPSASVGGYDWVSAGGIAIKRTGEVGIGTNSPGTKLEIKADGDTSQEVIKIRNNSGTEIMTIAAIDGSGDGYINFNSSPGIINTNSGNLNLDPAGDVVVDGASLYLPVAEKLYFGGGNHTYIGEDVDDRLRFFTGGDEFMRFTQQDAGGELFSIYQDVYVSDSKKIHFGDGADLRIWHDTSDNYVYGYGGNLYIGNTVDDADTVLLGDNGSGGMTAYLTIDGSTNTIFIAKDTKIDATKKLYLDGGGDTYIYEAGPDNIGVYVGGSHNMTFLESGGTNYSYVPDNAYLGAGTGIDFTIRHDTSHTYITNSTGDMNFVERDAGNINFRNNSGTSHLYIKTGGSVGIGTTSPGSQLDIENTTAPTLDNDTHAGEAIFIRSGGSGGDGNVQAVLAFGKADSSSRRSGSAIASVQTDSDVDKIGIGFYTSDGSASSQTMDIRGLLDHVGNFHVDADVVAYSSTVSDERLKDNVKTIDNALDKVIALRGVEFDWNKGNRKGQKDLGLIAQEVEKVLPEIVREKKMAFIDNEIYKTIDYDKVVGVLVEAIKEQQVQIDELKTQIGEQNG